MSLPLAATGAASAQDARVVLVDPAEALESAVRGSLSPWQVEVVAVPSPSPGAVMPGSSAAARSLAERHDAQAVVWVSRAEHGHALWIFDAAEQRVVARPLASGPPFDEATAAAVALSVKTLLRHSAVAPAAERWAGDGTEEARPEPPPPVVESVQPPGPDDERSPAAATVSPEVETDPARASSDVPSFALRTALGGRAGHTDPSGLELRMGLGLLWWPDPSGPAGVALDLASGPGLAVEDARFDGRLVDGAATLSLVLRRPLLGPIEGRVEGGAGIEVALLDGAVLAEGVRVEVWRVNPMLRAAAGVDWRAAPSFRVGIQGGATWLGRTQRYLARGNPLFELSTVSLELALVLEAGVF